jgi:hypothetical protein
MCAPVRFVAVALKSRWAGQCYGPSPRQRRSPDAEAAVLGRTRANQFDRRAQRRPVHTFAQAGSAPARPRPGLCSIGSRHAAGRSIFQRGSCPLPPAISYYGGGSGGRRGRPRGRCPRRRRSLVVPRDTALQPAAFAAPRRRCARARLAAAPATLRQRIHSFGAAARARGPDRLRAVRLPPPSCAFGK